MKIYLIISIDTECDKGPNWQVRQPLQFKNVLEGIPKRLQPLFEKYNLKPTYLLSPEVLMNDDCTNLFKSLNENGELGTHLHAEFIKPDPNWTAEYTNSFQSDYETRIEFEKLKNLTDLFKAKFDYYPESFRAGRFGISKQTLRFLQDLGYKVDSSVTPFWWWSGENGKGVNFLGSPYQPYHPSSNDFRIPGELRILEVPITIINFFWDKLPMRFQRRLNPLNRVQITVLNLIFNKKLRCMWLRPTFSSTEEMLAVSAYISQNASTDHIVLCMMFHSNEATASMSPYNSSDNEVCLFLKRLNEYFNSLSSKYEVQSIGLSETASFL